MNRRDSRTPRRAQRGVVASRALASASLFALLTGCPGNRTTHEAAADAEATSQKASDGGLAPRAAIELPEGTGPAAKVNGVDIPRDLFNREYVQTIERYERARHEVKPALRERLKDNIVRRLVDAEIIAQQAKKLEISIDDAEREAKWLEHKKRYGSTEAFKAFLERAGTSEEDVRRQFDANLLREKVFTHVSDATSLDEAEAKNYYQANKTRYEKPEQVKASHILIRLQATATPEEKAAKKKLAEEALAAAKAKNADFAVVAGKFGEDPTRDKGGDLGYFAKGRMVKPFEDAAWKLKVGQISGLVETPFGYHIIKKTDHQKARTQPFEEVREQIERSLTARKKNQSIRDALAQWKKDAAIEYFVKGDEKIIEAGQSASGDGGVNPMLASPVSPGGLDIERHLKARDELRPPSPSPASAPPPPAGEP